MPTYTETMSAGIILNGRARRWDLYRAKGGILLNGAAQGGELYRETASGGLRVGGKVIPVQIDGDRVCVCNSWTDNMDGGISCGGSAEVTDTCIKGGISCGGKAYVDVWNNPYDGLVAIWPLSENGGPYEDLGQWELDGIAGNPAPSQDTGVFCGNSQAFTDREYITVPQDPLRSNNPFSVSCWGKIDSFVKSRIFYSRGYETRTGDKWAFAMGHSFINHLFATLQTTDGTTDTVYECYSNTILKQETFYHLACSWQPGGSLKVYVAGVEDGSETTTETKTVDITNNGYFGKWNNSTSPTGNLQEVRLFADALGADWFKAEHDNFCLSTFYVVDPMEDATFV